MIKKIIALTYLLNCPLWAQGLYSLDDLRALVTQKNFNEFLDHANDIRPSQRQTEWQNMYRSMFIEMVDYKLKIDALDKNSYKMVEEHASKAIFKSDERIQMKRNSYAKIYFEKCYKSSDDKIIASCDEDLKKFWPFSNNDSDLGIEFSKIVRSSKSKLDSWQFVGSTLLDKTNSFYCNNPEIRQQIFNRITTISFMNDFDNNFKKLVTETVSNECFAKLKDFLKAKLLTGSTSSIERELVLNLMSSYKMLSDLEEDVFAVLYLSDGPVVGDKMNLAWKRVESLGLNQKKRNQVLDILKGLPLISDYTLKNPENQRNKAIINLFANNFPEFLNHYAKECITYISFKSDDKTQVRNRQCQNFLETAINIVPKAKIAPQWVSDLVKAEYLSTKKK